MRPRRRRRLEKSISSMSGMSAKPPSWRKTSALHKERLIAEKWPRNLADAPQQSLPPSHPHTSIVESPMKCSPNNSLRPCGVHERDNMLWAQLRVGMMEAEERGACDLRSGIHLRSPRRFLTNNEAYSTGTFQVPQALRWLHCSDNPFDGHMIDLQPVIRSPTRASSRQTGTINATSEPLIAFMDASPYARSSASSRKRAAKR